MLVGITNQWTEVDWTGLDSQKRQKEVTHHKTSWLGLL